MTDGCNSDDDLYKDDAYEHDDPYADDDLDPLSESDEYETDSSAEDEDDEASHGGIFPSVFYGFMTMIMGDQDS